MQKPPSRLERLLDFLAASPDDTFLLFALAKEYESMGDLEKSLRHYAHLVEVDPDYVGAYYHLGKLQEKLGQPATAFATYKTGMEAARRNNDQHALSELAGAKLALGDDEDFE
ncbi:MAG TPA: tetratricopeptide repeat protein [Bacteroidetes bacterium]|nr:tetratricopeptide repeat protein [Bacteroidota bacterium]